MGVRGLFKFIFRTTIQFLVIGVILVLIPNLPPHANFTKPFRVTPAKPFTGKLELNDRLEEVEVWHKGDFVGPESFAHLNGELYTSLYTGDIVKLTGEHITPVVKFGKACKESYEESICGRPLGIQFDENGDLYAADSYFGIFKVNVKTGEKVQLVSPNTEIDGKRPKIFNSIAVARNGDIYWTDSSTDFKLEDGIFSFVADPSGRLIRYDAKTKKNTVLLDELHFANGVALSEDEEFVIVAETVRSTIYRYYLKGPKKGTHNVFVDGLPGLPDNLKSDGKGGFLVPLVLARDADHPTLVQSIGPFPLLRKAVARFMGLIQYLFQKIDQLYPNDVSLKAVHFIGHFSSLPRSLVPARTTLLRVNRNGEITDSVHSLGGKIGSISEMHVFRDSLYLGSPFNDYVGRISLAKLGWEDLRQDERVKRAAPAMAVPKPITTTQKPTATTARTTPTPTTPKPTTTTTRKPTTTTPKPSTTTPKPTKSTQKATTTTTTPKPVTKPVPKQTAAPLKQPPPPQQAKPSDPPAKEAPKQAPPQQQQQRKQVPPSKQQGNQK